MSKNPDHLADAESAAHADRAHPDPRWVAQSLTQWATVVDAMNQIMCLVDRSGVVLHANRCIERWGLLDDADQAVGQRFHDLLHPACGDVFCGFAGLTEEMAAAREQGKGVLRVVDDAQLGRRIEVSVLPVSVMASQGGEEARDAAVIRLHDDSAHRRTEEWLRSSVEELSLELRKRTTALEQSNDQWQRAETDLRRSQSEFRLVSAALMTMQEMERKRIATELHDSIGASLSALSFGVGVALDSARGGDLRVACDMLEKLAAQVKETVGEVRRIAMDLRPATLDDLGIVGTLSWFFREFRGIHPGLALETEVNLYEEDVAPALRTTIFRVVQEALNNVVKHAAASEIRVRLWRTEREIRLEIADDGRGIPAGGGRRSTSGSGMGLKGMRDRTEFSGGSFDLESEPECGTRISASWPLRAE